MGYFDMHDRWEFFLFYLRMIPFDAMEAFLASRQRQRSRAPSWISNVIGVALPFAFAAPQDSKCIIACGIAYETEMLFVCQDLMSFDVAV